MIKLFQFLLLTIFLNGFICWPQDRVGYQYVPEENTWLGFHQIPATWPAAHLHCHLEGGQLASPTSDQLAAAMRAMMAARGLALGRAFTGIHDALFKGDYAALDGTPLANISLPWAAGEPDNADDGEHCLAVTGAGELADVGCGSTLPYFCQKDNHKMNLNECGTTATGYELDRHTRSCYKFHRAPQPWHRAAAVCAAERAHLAIINSDAESEALEELLSENRRHNLKTRNNNLAYIGIYYWHESGEWMTIYDETLEEAGFARWNDNEPNNVGGVEYCGSIVVGTGRLNDVQCNGTQLAFICEITP